MTVTLMFSDESEWSGGFGEADVERDVPAGPDIPFVAGSISKTFVAATVLQLVDEGELALTDPLSNWLPDYPRAGEIQIVHLLSHTSGVFNYFEDPDYNDSVFQTEVGRDWEPSEILDEFGGPPYCDPGTCFHYSNTGFVLLGLVIEQVTGESLGTVFTERFFEPLGMTDTYFQEDAPPPPGTAVGYLERPVGLRPVDDGSGYRPTKSAATVAWAAGAVVSTAHDLAVWVRALYGGEIVSRDSLERMIGTDYSPRADEIYGLGTRSRFFGDVQMYGHTGSLRGFYAAAWHVPSQDLTIVVMTNLGRIDPNEIVDDLADVVL
jgi:D-alanyl-D-alanine carboxypeptidase